MKPLLIYGASYPETFNLIEDINQDRPTWEIVGVIDDSSQAKEVLGYPLLGNNSILNQKQYKQCYVSNNVHRTTKSRASVALRIQQNGYKIPTLVHPSVSLRRVCLGEGVTIMQGVCLGARAHIADHSAVRFNATINHDNYLSECCFVGPGATLCGYVTAEKYVYIGAGAIIKERIKLGENAMVGMGAIVVKDVDPETTVVGNPARDINMTT